MTASKSTTAPTCVAACNAPSIRNWRGIDLSSVSLLPVHRLQTALGCSEGAPSIRLRGGCASWHLHVYKMAASRDSQKVCALCCVTSGNLECASSRTSSASHGLRVIYRNSLLHPEPVFHVRTAPRGNVVLCTAIPSVIPAMLAQAICQLDGCSMLICNDCVEA